MFPLFVAGSGQRGVPIAMSERLPEGKKILLTTGLRGVLSGQNRV